MWCKQCQQDVPGLFSAEAGSYCCSRCKAELSDPATGPVSDADREPIDFHALPDAGCGGEDPPRLDEGWDLEERLRRVERLLRIDRGSHGIGSGSQRKGDCHQRAIRIDAAHDAGPQWHFPKAAKAKAARKQAGSRAATGPRMPVLTWTALTLGLMAFTCGGVLLGWSAATERQDLWTIGMPIAVAGQVVLLIGLVLQLDRLWHDTRHNARKLHHVDEQLQDLNTATTLLCRDSAGSRSFYAHMGSGASPQLLLADMKSQLDLLAVKLGQTEQ
jgi:hypothetical protein